MTRREFIEDCTTIGELIEFCSDEGLNFCEDIYDEDTRDEIIDECLVEWAHDNNWRDLRDKLLDITTGYSYYRDDGDWTPIDDSDAEDIKEEILDYMDRNDRWDDEDDEAPEDALESYDDDDVLPGIEDFPVSDFFSESIIVGIRERRSAEEREESELSDSFLSNSIDNLLEVM